MFQDGNDKVESVPVCDTEEAKKAGVCRCATTNIDLSLKGNNCSLPEPSHGRGWCFLENVEHPEEPACNCYADATWSQTHSRFFSNDACDEDKTPEKGVNCEHIYYDE